MLSKIFKVCDPVVRILLAGVAKLKATTDSLPCFLFLAPLPGPCDLRQTMPLCFLSIAQSGLLAPSKSQKQAFTHPAPLWYDIYLVLGAIETNRSKWWHVSRHQARGKEGFQPASRGSSFWKRTILLCTRPSRAHTELGGDLRTSASMLRWRGGGQNQLWYHRPANVGPILSPNWYRTVYKSTFNLDPCQNWLVSEAALLVFLDHDSTGLWKNRDCEILAVYSTDSQVQYLWPWPWSRRSSVHAELLRNGLPGKEAALKSSCPIQWPMDGRLLGCQKSKQKW